MDKKKIVEKMQEAWHEADCNDLSIEQCWEAALDATGVEELYNSLDRINNHVESISNDIIKK